MALPKLFQRIFWQNNTTPAINEDNLNSMSKAIDDIDDRVIEIASDVMETLPELENDITQAEGLIDRLEELTENPPYIGANGDWYVWNTTTGEYEDSGIDASITVDIEDITMLAPDATPYVTNTGTDTDPVFHLYIPRGKGITSCAKTGTSGLVDTYTITYSDGYTTTFDVTNGKTAYQSAVEGGYSGTEAQFESDLANFGGWATSAAQSKEDSEAYAIGKRNGQDVPSSDATYHNNSKYYSEQAASSSTSASGFALDAEAYGAGTRNGQDVPSTDPAYHNNAKYYSEQAAAQSFSSLADVDINSSTLANGDVPIYNSSSSKWENGTIDVSGKMNKDGSNADTSGVTINAPLTVGARATGTVGTKSMAQGDNVVASGNGAFASGKGISGYPITASGAGAHAEGNVENTGEITASGAGAHTSGRVGYTGILEATTHGSHAFGYANGSNSSSVASKISASGSSGGNVAGGKAGDGGQIISNAGGASAFGYANGGSIKAQAQGATAFGQAQGTSTIYASGAGAHAEGSAERGNIYASGDGAHAEGSTPITSYTTNTSNYSIYATKAGAHAEGCVAPQVSGTNFYIEASGQGAHAEGFAGYNYSRQGVTASGDGAHAEGVQTASTGRGSHSEGLSTSASGSGAHAEGQLCGASGIAAHAEGASCYASKNYSHAGGQNASASVTHQFVHGNGSSSNYKFRTATHSMASSMKHIFGFALNGDEISSDNSDDASTDGYEGIVLGTATKTLVLTPGGQYLLICSSYTLSSGAIYGATARMIVAHGTASGTPTILSLGQTSNAPATISVAANNKITIKNGATARGTQYSLIRIN